MRVARAKMQRAEARKVPEQVKSDLGEHTARAIETTGGVVMRPAERELRAAYGARHSSAVASVRLHDALASGMGTATCSTGGGRARFMSPRPLADGIFFLLVCDTSCVEFFRQRMRKQECLRGACAVAFASPNNPCAPCPSPHFHKLRHTSTPCSNPHGSDVTRAAYNLHNCLLFGGFGK